MIMRSWKGSTAAADADAYLDYLRRTGLRAYAATPGNRGVVGLRRIRDGRAEFLLLTLWDSMEAVRRFAGAEPERAVFYPEDDRFLVERDRHVDHFEVVHAAGVATGTGGGAGGGAGAPVAERRPWYEMLVRLR